MDCVVPQTNRFSANLYKQDIDDTNYPPFSNQTIFTMWYRYGVYVDYVHVSLTPRGVTCERMDTEGILRFFSRVV